MFDKSTFCIIPWSTILINPSGDFRICCFSGVDDDSFQGNDHGVCLDEDGNVINILTHSIKDALNSQYHKSLRLAQSKNERHGICKVCWDRDDACASKNIPTNSMRAFRSFVQLPNMDKAIPIHVAKDHMQEDGSIDEFPISLDLRFTNVCNMKCVMCNSRYSNQWYADEMKLYNKTYFTVDSNKKYNITVDNGVYKTDMPVWHDSPIWWKKFDEIKHRVQHLYLTGGEPFIIKGHDVLLDKLIEDNLASKVILEYDTNLSVINEKILKRLSHFKQVIISVSCDDVEDKYDLIRSGGNFQILLKNLEKIKQKNIEIRWLTTCTGIYSVFSPIRLYEYFTPLGYKNFGYRFLRAPWHSDLAMLPDHLKEKVIEVYNTSNLPQHAKDYYIGYLENNMGKYSKDQCERHVYAHIDFLNKLDELRGTNWKETLPDVVLLLKEYL